MTATTVSARPRLHFAPEKNWMNDPNGLIHHGGRYHVYFQHNPSGADWGNMSWGHASSDDLLHWEEHPVALWADDGEAVFSGSIVYDAENTSGLGTVERPPLVAIYTAATDGHQAQAIASSADGGFTWTKHGVVIDRGTSDFRDPKVFRHSDHWILIAVEALDRQAHLFRSHDLTHWEPLSVFGGAGAREGIWECPDLFPLDGRWVLTLSVNPGHPSGGSGMQYFVGDFDGTSFVAESWHWLDLGRDFYAGVTVGDARNRIMIGWMSNWMYAHAVPTSPWRGSMALPRVLGLRDGRLIQLPAPIPSDPSSWQATELPLTTGLTALPESAHGSALRIRAGIRPAGARAGIAVRASADGSTSTTITYEAGELIVDRTASGDVGFAERFASLSRASLPLRDGVIELDIWVDASSVEVFADGGSLVITEQIFPAEDDIAVLLSADKEGATVEHMAVTVFER